ncbi:hypothetical protein [Clostridium perfringens]|uniref:Phage protein n=1 Tax=Clostridium perfringens TaxID=1502 RepID=A0AAP4EGX1_CLOPF|nr:hypothetical protein [Clostridium perfringens]MDH2337296.1 hypothetical protein [Clostridium perfringens]
MRQSSYTIGAAQKNILAIAGDHFITIPMKVTKTNVTDKLVNGVLEAGTLLNNKGSKVSTSVGSSDAWGIVFTDVDFNDSKGTEVVPVLIHGVVDTKKIKLDDTNHAKEIEVLKNIIFLGEKGE